MPSRVVPAKKPAVSKKSAAPERSLAKVDARPEAPDVPLTDRQRRLLAEALRRGEETRDAVEDAIVSFGRRMLVNVFDDDAAAALNGRTDNAVWRALLARCGGARTRLDSA